MAITDYGSRTTVQYLFKNLFLPRLRVQFYKATPLMSRVKKMVDAEDFTGKKAVIAAHVGWSEAVSSGSEGMKLPEPYYEDVANMEVDVTRNRGRIRVDRLAIKASRNSAGAWQRMLDFHMKSMKENIGYDVARQMIFGDGTGKLAQLSAQTNAGSDVCTVDGWGTRLLRKNMSVGFDDGAGEDDAATLHRIESVDSSTQFTLTSNAGANLPDDSWVYRKPVPTAAANTQLAKDTDLMGLGGIIDDGTRVATFQTLGRTANPWLKANIMTNPASAGTNRALTLPLLDEFMQKGADGTGAVGSDEGISAVYSKHVFQRLYMDLCRDQRRFVNTKKVDGGWEAPELHGKPWFVDRLCRDNEVWGVAEEDLGYWVLAPLDWVDDDGSVVSRRADYDEVEAYITEYAQLGAHRCNRHVALKDLLES